VRTDNPAISRSLRLTAFSTTGGKGGQVINVSTFEQLEKAAQGTAPAIIVVSGKIQHEGKIRVGSNKSFIGKNSQAGMYHNVHIYFTTRHILRRESQNFWGTDSSSVAKKTS
jgi:pectate lyase